MIIACLLLLLFTSISCDNSYLQSEGQVKLFACSVLGKYLQENDKPRARLEKYSSRFASEYDSDFEQGYNVINLICLRSCVKCIDISHASAVIIPSYKISSKDLKPLNLISALSVFDSYENKDILLDELDELNLQLVNLSKGIAVLKSQKEADNKRKEGNIKRQQKEESQLNQKYKEGISFQSKLDKDAMITVKQNEAIKAEKQFDDPNDYDISKLTKAHVHKINSEDYVNDYKMAIYELGNEFFELMTEHLEIVLGVLGLSVFYLTKSIKKRRKKKILNLSNQQEG